MDDVALEKLLSDRESSPTNVNGEGTPAESVTFGEVDSRANISASSEKSQSFTEMVMSKILIETTKGNFSVKEQAPTEQVRQSKSDRASPNRASPKDF
jgi:hypothetical protein